MAPAASAQSRGAARVSMNNYRLLVLLCLAFAPHLLAAKEFQKNERKWTPGLKHAADSLINKDQLQQAMEYLQDAVDHANKRKAERMQTITVTKNYLDTKWKILYPQIQQVLMESDFSSPVTDLLIVLKRLLEKVRIHVNLQKKSFTAEPEDMERELEGILKMSNFQENLHTEL